MPKDYSYQGEDLFFKHEISHNLSKDAYSMHSHNTYELLYFVSGDATHVIEDRKYKLKRGDLVLIRPSKYHFIKIDSACDYERYDILFSPKTKNIDCLSLIENLPEIINLEEYPMATEIIKKTDFYFKHFGGEDFEKILTGLLTELFYLLSVSAAPVKNYSSAESSQVLSRAVSYINSHLNTVKDISEVAAHCFVTESYLFRLFKRELHHTPKKYITEKRLLYGSSFFIF